ncbi:MlaD family protein [Flavobacterium sp. HJ-32-4]|uniref:MlaD family protein n=1 Tax=Flavobacterium sp. HJ-32-4 TaxID=1160795 RepID=UPI001F13FFE3|nr:MlaD family protein [Flavobacterium sp. HJ-32-4]UMY66251.1 MlaD family protein [Flavobacterium sp. HJ-32-4]
MKHNRNLMQKIGFLLAIFWLLDSCSQRQETYRMYVKFNNVEGLNIESIVESRGVTIGKVRKMDLCQNGVIVEVEIDKKVKIPVDSKFCVKDRGVLTRSIEVTMVGKKRKILTEKDTVDGLYLPIQPILDKM